MKPAVDVNNEKNRNSDLNSKKKAGMATALK